MRPSRFKYWGIEVAARYLPMVRIVRQRWPNADILEVGSGTYGIAPYLNREITGLDTDFREGAYPLLKQVKSSVLKTPYGDRECGLVISADMLEHIPPKFRAQSIDEAVRIANLGLVIAFPSGSAAYSQDKLLADYYTKVVGKKYAFFDEHIENGLPDQADIDAAISSAARKYKRKEKVQWYNNSNLFTREILMKVWIRSSKEGSIFAKVLWRLLIFCHPLVSRMNFGVCYRKIVVVEFLDAE